MHAVFAATHFYRTVASALHPRSSKGPPSAAYSTKLDMERSRETYRHDVARHHMDGWFVVGLGFAVSEHRQLHRRNRGDSANSLRFLPLHPTGQYSKKCPQVDGHVLHLSGRHAKLRREGYRK